MGDTYYLNNEKVADLGRLAHMYDQVLSACNTLILQHQ
jgi:hypothetical protein